MKTTTGIPKEKFLNKLRSVISKNKTSEDVIFNKLCESGYVIPMALRYAAYYTNDLIDHIPRFSSADHGTILKTLLTFISKCLDRQKSHETKIFCPYFDLSIGVDSLVKKYFDLVTNQIYLKNILTSVEAGYWKVSLDNELFYISLSEPLRRSGLSLISIKSEYLEHNESERKILSTKLSDINNVDKVSFILRTSMNEIRIFKEGIPEAWNKFTNRLNFYIDDVQSFQGFLPYLMNKFLLWYQTDDLWDLWKEYTVEYNQTISKKSFLKLLDFFSVDITNALSWGIPIPLIKIGSWYIYWPFHNHILHPSLSFLALVMKKYQNEWNNTLGSEMAKISNYLKNNLLNFSNVKIATLKKKRGIGDIDLAIYDFNSKHLFVCEIKTVFDKFRTNYQLSNFSDQKVNFRKANNQLRKISTEISSGQWKLSDIFNTSIKELPNIITLIILTWWDLLNLNLETNDEDILCCNFKSFQYLYNQSKGDLDLLRNSIKQLSKLFCVAQLNPRTFTELDKSTQFIIEAQTDALSPLNMLDNKLFTNLVREEIHSLPHFPEDWGNKCEEQGIDADSFHFYPFTVR